MSHANSATQTIIFSLLVLMLLPLSAFSQIDYLAGRVKANLPQAKQSAIAAKKAYHSGDYYGAAHFAIASLRVNPNQKTAMEILQKAYSPAKTALEAQIAAQMLHTSASQPRPEVWRAIVEDYDKLITLTNDARALPPLVHKKLGEIHLDHTDYSQSRQEAWNAFNLAQNQTAEAIFVRASEMLSAARTQQHAAMAYEAAGLFDQVSDLLPGYRDAEMWEDEAQHLGDEYAAASAYQHGMSLLAQAQLSRDHQVARKAAEALLRAHKLVPGYKDALAAYQEAQRLAIRRLAVLPLACPYYEMPFRYAGEQISDGVTTRLLQNKKVGAYTELVDRRGLMSYLNQFGMPGDPISAEVFGRSAGVELILSGKIVSITLDDPLVETRTIERSKEIQIGSKEEALPNGGSREVPSYSTVRAQITHYTQRSHARVRVIYSLIEASGGKILLSKEAEQSWTFVQEWSSYTGHQEALTAEDSRLCALKQQALPPAEAFLDEILPLLADEIAASIPEKL